MTYGFSARDWDSLRRRHEAFWDGAEVDRPLIGVIHDAYQDTELVAAAVGEAELRPEAVDPGPILAEYDRIAAAREVIGDDMIGVGEGLLGVPWLEAICGCRVMVPEGKSLWPEPPDHGAEIQDIAFSAEDPWFQALLRVQRAVVAHAGGRYAVSVSHLRGPTDVLAALMGSPRFLTALYDEPARVERLAGQAPKNALLVSESGIATREDVQRVAAVGVDAVLVGTVLMKSDEPDVAVRSLTGVSKVRR